MKSRVRKKLDLNYPFNAIVDQENVKNVLILNAIDPSIGGALISGPKGTGKSLLVKSFSEVLPCIDCVSGCQFHCSSKDPTNMCLSCREKTREGVIQTSSEQMRIIQVPLSVTEDMLVGSLDMEKTVVNGDKAVEYGLLAEANQNILYIDEVNLLPDHITDSILDAAASGWNTVEREGVSVSHPSRFILVGTMNPEEGELRPQILDRFGIFAETKNIQDPELRTQVIDRNERFLQNSEKFRENYVEGLEELRKQVQDARERISLIEVPAEVYPLAAEICSRLKVDGFRPDIITIKTARALAAFQGRGKVSKEDIMEALELTLMHRTRQSGMLAPPNVKDIKNAFNISELRQKLNVSLRIPGLIGVFMIPTEIIERLKRSNFISMILEISSIGLIFALSIIFLDYIRYNYMGLSSSTLALLIEFLLPILFIYILERFFGRIRREKRQSALGVFDQELNITTSGKLQRQDQFNEDSGVGELQSKVRYIGEDTSELGIGPKILDSMGSLHKRLQKDKKKRGNTRRKEGSPQGGRRTKVVSQSSRGRYSWYQIPRDKPRDIAIIPTLKVAATKQIERGRKEHTIIKPEDIREKIREYYAPYSIVLLVDMSLSMTQSMFNVIKSIYDLHSDVYRRRDRVGLVVFKGSKAYTLQHPTRNLDLVVKKIKEVGASDFTPLPAGLLQAWKTLKQEKMRNKDSILHLYVISDGIANVALDLPLSPLTRRRYSNEAQADTFDVARLLMKEGIKVHVVNTNHKELESPHLKSDNERISMKPTQFMKELARVSHGDYIGLAPNISIDIKN